MPTSNRCRLCPSTVARQTFGQNRLRISQDTIENTKGAVRTTIELLSVAAQMTQNVPYLGAISTALTAFMRIHDEVNQCKEECRGVVDDAEQINALVKKFRNKCVASGRADGALNETLREEFAELERVVLECALVMQKCQTKFVRRRDRLRLYWRRTELLKSVQGCATKLSKACQRFDRALHVDIIFLLDGLRDAVGEIWESVQTSRVLELSAPSSVPLSWSLRAAPLVFHGREAEVDHAVDLIVGQAPARVAILGPGGIGKTSIALAILHDPNVKGLYGDRRCFMSCEATTTGDGIVRALADSVGFVLGNDPGTAAQRRLIHHLGTVTGLICLDNLETPLDADKRAVEELLNDIAALPSVALLITSRDTSMPPIKWTCPPLPPIEPFSLEAAIDTWDSICVGHDDYAVKLVEAVDYVPLAVTLLARLARIEKGGKNVWTRWVVERTDLIKSGGEEHRLYNLGASIETSLTALPYQEAIDALAIICIFPEGLWYTEIDQFEEALKDHLSIRPALTLLKQYSLIYVEDIDQWYNSKTLIIRVLSPIRHHMLQHRNVSDELFLTLADIFPSLQRHGTPSRDAYLEAGLARGKACRERCLGIVASDTIPYMSSAEVLFRAFEVACAPESPSNDPHLYRRLGILLRLRGQNERARVSLERAIALDEARGHREAQFQDWAQWVYAFQAEFLHEGSELDQKRQHEVREALGKAYRLGFNENRMWDQGLPEYLSLAQVHRRVTEDPHTPQMPMIHPDSNVHESLSWLLPLESV